MKGLLRLSLVVACFAVFAAAAQAAVIFDATYVWTGTEADQTGRLTRDGIQSVWGSVKPTPPLFDSVLQDFKDFGMNSGSYTHIAVTITPISDINIFSAAYSSFNPADPTQNYLADAGVSTGAGVQLAPYSYYFDIASFTNFVVTLSTVDGVGTAGTGSTHVLVEGFTTVPEPTSILILGSGLVGLGFMARRRMRRS